MARTFPVRSADFIEQLGRAFVLGTPTRAIAIMFAITTTELRHLVRREVWAARSETLSNTTPSERAAAARAADAAHQVELYGDAATVDDVRLLRRQGFVVHREGQRCRVGNTLCSLADLRAKAARERRLMEADRPRKAAPIGAPASAPRRSTMRLQAVPASLHARPQRLATSVEVAAAPAV
jgi:hypothetical protein